MDDSEKAVLLKMIATGALAGTGVGLYSNLQKHHKLLKQQAALAEQERARSITPASDVEKMAKAPPLMATGMGIAGGLGAGVLAKSVVDKVYQAVRRKELTRQLQDAEEAYTAALLAERDSVVKGASGSFPRLTELIGPAMIAALPIAAIGSGVATNKLLDKHFGPQPGTGGIPRLRLGDLPALTADEEEEEDDSPRRKIASWGYDDDVLCHLLGTVCALTKAADVRNLVRAVACGRGKEIEKHASTYGFEAVFDIVKGADNHRVDAKQFAAAQVRLVKSASLRPSLEILVAAEMLEHFPHQIKLARTLAFQPQVEMLDLLQKEAQLLRAYSMGYFEDNNGLEKAAAEINEATRPSDLKIVEAMDSYLEKRAGIGEQVRRSSTVPVYDTQSARPSMESDPEAGGDDPSAFEQPAQDVVDMAMQRDGDSHTATEEKMHPGALG